jgi:hypothetical protein
MTSLSDEPTGQTNVGITRASINAPFETFRPDMSLLNGTNSSRASTGQSQAVHRTFASLGRSRMSGAGVKVALITVVGSIIVALINAIIGRFRGN